MLEHTYTHRERKRERKNKIFVNNKNIIWNIIKIAKRVCISWGSYTAKSFIESKIRPCVEFCTQSLNHNYCKTKRVKHERRRVVRFYIEFSHTSNEQLSCPAAHSPSLNEVNANFPKLISSLWNACSLWGRAIENDSAAHLRGFYRIY